MTTLLLASYVGPIMLCASLGIIFNKKTYTKMILGMDKDGIAVYMGGLTALIFGLLIVNNHNIWVDPASVIISLVGWMGLIKGIVLIIAPKHLMNLSLRIIKAKNSLKIAGIVYLIAGAYLTYLAYLAQLV